MSQNEEDYIVTSQTITDEPFKEEPVIDLKEDLLPDEPQVEEDQEQTPEEIERAKIEAKKAKSKRRFDELSSRALQAEREREELRRELEEIRSGKKPNAALENGEPDPESYTAGEYDPKYIKDLAKFEFKQELEIEKQHAIIQQKQLTEKQLIDKARKDIPDFDGALDEFNADPFTSIPQVQDIFDTSEDKIALMYYLGKNPDQLEKFYDMTPSQALAHIGRLDERLSKKTSTEPKKVTDAPKPITPLGSAKATTAVKKEADMTIDEYAAWYKEHRKTRSR
jgi:hypothetical protein